MGGFGTGQDQVQQDSEKNPEKVWEALVQSEPRQIQQNSREKRWEALVQSQVHQDSGEGMGGFGAEPGQIYQGSGEDSARFWCKARSNSLSCATI